jgi:predicted unusual protein kinase regulating ubiquinone biosynthesis (AarF/ABC1/UbiB family)
LKFFSADELSTNQVFTTELLDGIPVDQCFEMEPEDRRFIAEKIIELCLLELLEFRYMQTDPNWANFLYNPKKKQIMLLDFGASREYSKPFMDQYVRILKAACDADRETVLAVSKDLGFLTGYESRVRSTKLNLKNRLDVIFAAHGRRPRRRRHDSRRSLQMSRSLRFRGPRHDS